ncbi:hypothetical protein CC78DRAFT_618082 [Lojkania enalia]|uniref:Uncharacterized protein n=1 Tax=Lojkania enalia TaxID=147567 RepID=A0A9P4K6F7_9PLEO|nr:hypothetical protein CC78DRAFT_618082 [Didymosphaeria enalia]
MPRPNFSPLTAISSIDVRLYRTGWASTVGFWWQRAVAELSGFACLEVLSSSSSSSSSAAAVSWRVLRLDRVQQAQLLLARDNLVCVCLCLRWAVAHPAVVTVEDHHGGQSELVRFPKTAKGCSAAATQQRAPRASPRWMGRPITAFGHGRCGGIIALQSPPSSQESQSIILTGIVSVGSGSGSGSGLIVLLPDKTSLDTAQWQTSKPSRLV